MPMNDEVRKAVEALYQRAHREGLAFLNPTNADAKETIRAELTRLTEIADQYDPLVVRLGDVTEKLGRANALLVECRRLTAHYFSAPNPYDLYERIQAHLSEPRT
jgi:hypothetical protein